MKIVKPTGSEDIKLIFRPKTPLNTTITLQTRSKSTNKVTTHEIDWVSDQNYYLITLTDAIKTSADLVNGTYFEITLSDVDTLLTRETLFVTTQTINQELNDKYNANKGRFTPVESTNEYIILE
jgi:hypothetical protein|tara:strand:+ start:126 stop:497 length:372 start_codon:yes stop_codon:yes gene_type:complete